VGARSKARKRALDVLYEADLRGTPALETAARRLAQADPPFPAYAVRIVEGVVAHADRINELVATYAHIFESRFPGSSKAWLNAITRGGPMPAQPGPSGATSRPRASSRGRRKSRTSPGAKKIIAQSAKVAQYCAGESRVSVSRMFDTGARMS